MADIDKVLDDGRGDVARAAADAAQLPDFETLARRGRGRRTRRQAGALAAAALAVAGIVGAVQVFGNGDGDARPAPPVDQTTEPAEPTDDATATDGPSQDELAAIVDAHDRPPNSLAAIPGDPDSVATVWQDGEARDVLAVTADGFATRELLELPSGSLVTAGPDGRFVVRRGWNAGFLLVSPDGTTEPVGLNGAAGPVGAAEVPIDTLDPETADHQLMAVGADGTAHPVETPEGLDMIESFGNRLAGSGYTESLTYHWSDDGGATWQDSDPGPGEYLPLVARAAIGQDHTIIEGSDGATLFPFVALRTAGAGTPDQWSRTAADESDGRVTIGGAWNEDGEIRVLASRWNGEDRIVDAGVFRVVGGGLEKVASNHPEISDQADIGALAFEYVDGPVVWLPGKKSGEIWRTTDGGSTWEKFAAR